LEDNQVSQKKVLVVDDEYMIRDILHEIFKTAGYTALLADSAENAIDILRKESVMVMFLDLDLPGMNGIDLCKKIRKDNPLGIIYALTGHVDLFSILECRRAGFDDFFVKPAKREIILAATEQAFEKVERWEVTKYGLI